MVHLHAFKTFVLNSRRRGIVAGIVKDICAGFAVVRDARRIVGKGLLFGDWAVPMRPKCVN